MIFIQSDHLYLLIGVFNLFNLLAWLAIGMPLCYLSRLFLVSLFLLSNILLSKYLLEFNFSFTIVFLAIRFYILEVFLGITTCILNFEYLEYCTISWKSKNFTTV